MQSSGGVRKERRRREPARIIVARGDRAVRTIHIRPRLIILATAVTLTLAAAYFGGIAYLFVRDDLINRAASQEAAIAAVYERQLADMRTEVDRAASARLVAEALVANEIADLLLRQSNLMNRQADLDNSRRLVETVLERARSQGIDLAADLTPLPIPNPLRASAISTAAAGTQGQGDIGTMDFARAFAALEEDLARMAGLQADAVRAVAIATETRIAAIEAIVDGSGLPVVAGGAGGPFIAIATGGTELDVLVQRAESAMAYLMQLETEIRGLPLGVPVTDPQMTSPFGTRRDPFTGGLARHEGIDFRAATGDAVYATGPGVVVHAATNGGYGLMVEIDHGGGIVTRYAHLSALGVSVGQAVESGTQIGRAGSTGRSTGPHVHYETRIDGVAVDPMRYVDAGFRLDSVITLDV